MSDCRSPLARATPCFIRTENASVLISPYSPYRRVQPQVSRCSTAGLSVFYHFSAPLDSPSMNCRLNKKNMTIMGTLANT